MLDRLTQIIMMCVVTALIPAAYVLNRSLAYGTTVSAATAVDCEFADAFLENNRAGGFQRVIFNDRIIARTRFSAHYGLAELELDRRTKDVLANAKPFPISECGIPTDLVIDLSGVEPPQPYDLAIDWRVPVITMGRAIRSSEDDVVLLEYELYGYFGEHGYWSPFPILFEARKTDDGWVFKELRH